MDLTTQQRDLFESFREFARKEIEPHADAWDAEEAIPAEFVEQFAARGWLGALAPSADGGPGFDAVTFGLLNEAVGEACSSVRSLLTVHSMVVHAVSRWGGAALRARWLPALAAGTSVGAFALTEDSSGNDAGNMRTEAVRDDDGWMLTGVKKWTTYGARADVFLVFAGSATGPVAFLVERDRPGVGVVPVHGMLGTRASMLAELRFDGVRLPADAVVGRPGFGMAAVATSGLDIGRYSVAWGCVGILGAALRMARDHARGHERFGVPLADHQLVRRMLSDVVVHRRAARLLCWEAGRLKDQGDPRTVNATWAAKYFASCRAAEAASDAVQILGARGCAPHSPASRLYRDAKVMEIIEGSTEIQQIHLADADDDDEPYASAPAGGGTGEGR